MKLIICLAFALGLAGCANRQPTSAQPLESGAGQSTALDLPPQITSFIAEKEKHAQKLAEQLMVKAHDDYWTFFRQARRGDWPATSKLYESLKDRTAVGKGSTNDPSFDRTAWQTVVEAKMVFEFYTPSNNAPKWSTAFGEAVAKSIPRGSIYFGGNGAGRVLPAAFSTSRVGGGAPFFTLTQNALADGSYLHYIRDIHGAEIQLPSNEDSQRCFQAYLDDAQKRLQHDRDFPNEPRQLKPGEDVTIENNKVNVSGHVAVMGINALLTKVIFDRNPEREFYVEESFPLDWMYPHLTPHGFITKLNREPLNTLPAEAVTRDHEFWSRQLAPMIGDWLTVETSVKEVCDFAEKVFLKKDLSGFQGDPSFVSSDGTIRMYSKLRCSIGGLYNWRFGESKGKDEQQRMIREADFAFRQAFVLCPVSPEAIFRYINLLVQLQRIDDALLIARTAERLNPKEPQLLNLISELERIRNAQPK